MSERVMKTSIRRHLAWFASLCLLLAGAEAGAQDQTAIISGRVTSESGSPLAAANVYITELNISTRTNEEGRYTITIPAARVSGQPVVLRVRSVSFVPQQRNITVTPGTQTIDFALANDFTRLTDVVVTGVTGATERVKVPFTVARVDTSMMPVLGVNPLSQLQGKVAGATISSVSGRPGSTPSVILRGPTSINATGRGQEPLYIVDGVILQGSNPLGDINANDIESVEIVKGAAAASLYGSRAGAGVIAITTRRGQGADGVSFNVRQEVGFNDVERDFGIARHHTLLLDETGTRFCAQNAYSPGSNKMCARSIDYRQEVARINNQPGDYAPGTVSFPVDPGAVTTGDILRRAFLTNPWPGTRYNAVAQLVDPKPLTITDVSLTGRSGGTSFFGSLNYTGQGGAIAGLNGLQRLGGRINVGQTIGDQWDVQLNSYFSRSTADGSQEENGGGNGFFRLTRTPAIVDVTQRDTLGRLYIRSNLGAAGVQNENPLYPFEAVQREDLRYRYTGGATVRYTPLEWFDVEGNFSIDRLNANYSQFSNRGYRTTSNDPFTNNGLIFNGVENDQSMNTSLQATIRRELASELQARFNFRALFERQDYDNRNIEGYMLAVSGVEAGENATEELSLSSSENSTRQGSFSGGVFLDFRDRYTADFLVRRDGSSRFGPEQRWQTYGRASAAWLASREGWWPEAGPLSQLTLRTSIGTAGNVPRFDAQYETYTIGSGGSLSQETLGNTDLKPEVITEWESGIEMELFSRLGLNVTYAQAESKNQILPVAVSVATGFPRQWQNAGTLESKTWEVSLAAPFIQRENLQWSGQLNYSSNRTHIRQLDVPPFSLDPGATNTGGFIRIEEGLRFGTIFGRKFMRSCGDLPANFQDQCGTSTSQFQRNDEGYLVWTGGYSPGDGITENLWSTRLPAADSPYGVQASWGSPIVIRQDNGSARQTALGNVLPDYQLGFSQNFTWKRIGAFALLDGKFGQDVYNQGRHWSYLDFLSDDVDQAGKSLQSAKPIGYYYRVGTPESGGIGGFYDVLGPNSRFVEDASFLKLREVSLSYRIGEMSGGDWSVSLIGRNLKTWTDYRGFDPEVGLTNDAAGNTTGSGVLNAVDAFTFPNLRSLSFVVSTKF